MKKKIISFIVAIAVVITSLNLPIASSAATQADGNLLYGLTAKYSNIGGNGASDIAAITDGNNANGSGHAWIQKATGTDYMWVQFDFNNATDINKIYLVQKWDYSNSKPLDFLDDIAIDVRLASGGWKRVAEAHDIPYVWNNTGKAFTFSKESVLSVRITANSLRNSNSNFCLVEVEGYCDESITEYSGIETLDNETYAIPKALSDMNLVRGMTAKYSNIYGQASDIALITDGNNANGTGHAWIQKATGTDYMWVQFDFNSATDINKIYLVQKWDYSNSKPLDFLDDIAIDVRLASGGWKRVAEAHDIPYVWNNTGKAFTFSKESVLSVRITANSLRNSNSNFCLVEVEGYCDESITEYSGIETLDNEVYAVPEALSDMNLVRGITATSSNNDGWFASNRPISNLTDGKSDPYSDMASIGNSNDDIYEWVQLDLPQAKLVNKVVIQHRDGETIITPKDYAIDVLLENGTWKRVATDYNLSSIYSPTTMTFSPEKVTSIKITSNGKRAGATSMHLTEVMAYYDCSISNYTGIEKVDESQYAIPLSSDTVNVLPGSTFTANNEYYDGWRPTNRPLGSLTDGVIEVNAGKTAMTPYNQTTGEAYINITLSEEKTINKVVINWAGYRTYEGYLGQTEDEASAAAEEKQAKDYAIDVRKKDGTWVRVVEQHNDYVKAWDTYKQTLCFEDITCTQIRITGYNANKQGSMAIMEMYAYCDSTVGTEEYTALETGVAISQPKSADWVKTEVPALDDYAYSFAVVGDTQIVSKNDAKNGTTDLSDMYQYIIDKKDEYKISQVIGLGDIVDTYADGDQKEAEWNVALNAIKKLDGVLPYTLIPGNHDVNWNFNYRIGNVGKLGYLNQSQIVSKYGKIEAYQAGLMTDETDEPSASNTAHAFTAGGRNYLILTLEYAAISTPGVMDWADKVVKAHPYHNVIVTTHAYLAADGSILDGTQAGSPSSYAGSSGHNNGDYFWNNLISQNDNIVMVLCGHVGTDDIVISPKVRDNGTTVTQIMINPQDLEAEIGSTGMLAFMYFSKDGKTVQLRQYSTVWDRYYGNASQTSFEIPVIEPIEGDVNADREVDVRDLIRYKKYVLKTDNSVVISELTSDLNSDSEFDTDDIIVLRKMLVGIEYFIDTNANKSVVYLSGGGKDK